MRKVKFLKILSYNLIIFLGVFVFFNAKCDREIPLVQATDNNTFPLDKGLYRIYEVKDTTFTTSDTLGKKYYIKEIQGNFEKDLLGRNVQRLERWKSDTTINFSFDELWTQYKDKETAERTEGNTRFVIMEFPMEEGKRWNGNRYNALGEQFYEYISIDTTVVVRGRIFEHCVFILKARIDDSFLENTLSYEIYAPNLGRIKRYEKHLKWIYDANGTKRLDTDSFIFIEELLTHN